MKKFVLLPIEVPENEYCWDGHYEICQHFDNEGGHCHCDLNLGRIKYDSINGNVPKPRKCLLLVNAVKKQNERM